MSEEDKEAEALLLKMREEFLQRIDDEIISYFEPPYGCCSLQEHLGFSDEEYRLFRNCPERLAEKRFSLEAAKTLVRWRKEAMASSEGIYYPLRKKK